MVRQLVPGTVVYVKECFYDNKRRPILFVNDDNVEEPLVDWQEAIFLFWGHEENVVNVNGVDFITRNVKIFAYLKEEPGMPIRTFWPNQIYLSRYDDSEE